MHLSIVLTLALQAPAPWTEAKLAEIPAGIEPTVQRIDSTNAGHFDLRTSLVWSADGTQVAYSGRRGMLEWLPVVGSEVGERYGFVSIPKVVAGHAFFTVGRSTGEVGHEAWFLWIDGREVEGEDAMGELAVSADGKSVAYWSQPGAVVGNVASVGPKPHILVIGREGKPGRWSFRRGKDWVLPAAVAPTFSRNGKEVFTCAMNRSGWVALGSTGRREKELSNDLEGIARIAISPDGKALAVVSLEGPTQHRPAQLHFRGKRVAKSYDDISMPVVGPRGKHVAYAVRVGDQMTVAVDGERNLKGMCDHVLEIAFDASGTRLAFIANRGGRESPETPGYIEGGECFAVVRSVDDPKEQVEEDVHDRVRDLTWSPGGERLAYAAKDASAWRLVCGDAQSSASDMVGRPYFAPDGTSIGFGSRDGQELWARVLALD